jgi:hypothetical protein
LLAEAYSSTWVHCLRPSVAYLLYVAERRWLLTLSYQLTYKSLHFPVDCVGWSTSVFRDVLQLRLTQADVLATLRVRTRFCDAVQSLVRERC